MVSTRRVPSAVCIKKTRVPHESTAKGRQGHSAEITADAGEVQDVKATACGGGVALEEVRLERSRQSSGTAPTSGNHIRVEAPARITRDSQVSSSS
jgi:hypothetical protein